MHYSKHLIKLICPILLLLSQVSAHIEEHTCAHNRLNIEPEHLEVEELTLTKQDSRLLAATTYPQIRITTDFSPLTDGTAEFINYVKNDLVPPVIDYFQAALQVKQPLTANLKIPTSVKTLCTTPVPAALRTGVATDFYLMVTSESDQENWVASASSCYISGGAKRPIVAQMQFNMVYTSAAGDDVLVHEKNMYLTMHEFMHALGFAGSNFKNFIDSDGNTLTDHVKSVSLNGSVRTVLDVDVLTNKLRTFFGCSSLPGAFMEDDGGAGTAGSHFERRHFLYETMTSGVIHGRRLSEFSLTVLEASGWYQPNYTYAEPFFYGQGQGCNFLYEACSPTKQPNFDDFCTSTSRSCTSVGRSGGICTSDTRSDNCSYVFPVLDYDCENDAASENARYPTIETYGRGLGSKCFEGNLTKLTKTSATSFCFKYNCVGTGLTTKVEVMLGTTKVTCAAAGNLKVTGYNGFLYCPDPLFFCNTVGKKYCPRNCMGRGTCVSGVCKCNKGYTGTDCALNV